MKSSTQSNNLHSDKTSGFAEEFILIPRRQYVESKSAREQILADPNISQKSTYLQMIANHNNNLTSSPEEFAVVQRPVSSTGAVEQKVFDELATLTLPQTHRARLIYKEMDTNPRLTVDHGGMIFIDNQHTNIHASSFLYDLQQPTKNLNVVDEDMYAFILKLLDLPSHLISNKNAKKFLTPTGGRKSPVLRAGKKRTFDDIPLWDDEDVF